MREFAGVRVSGLKELVAACKVIDEKLPDELRDINKAAAESLVGVARGLAPRLSGDLVGSIRAGATRRSGTIKAGGPKVLYAPPIHWGWGRRNIEPQPFLVEALQGNVDAIRDKYVRDLDAFLRRKFA